MPTEIDYLWPLIRIAKEFFDNRQLGELELFAEHLLQMYWIPDPDCTREILANMLLCFTQKDWLYAEVRTLPLTPPLTLSKQIKDLTQ